MSSLVNFLAMNLPAKVLLRHGSRALSMSSINHQASTNDPSIDNLLVIGSGLMGAGVAQQAATVGKFKSVNLFDISDKQLDVAKQKMVKNLQRMKSKKPELNETEIVNSIAFISNLDSVKNTSNLLVIEAVPEKLDLKQQLFADLDRRFGQDKTNILASNTSSLSCKDIAKNVTDTSRFAGLHFFNPVHLMRLVEIVRVEYPQQPDRTSTSEQTLSALRSFVKRIQRTGVDCRDTPGFIVNRLLLPYMHGAFAMVERRDATVPDVDTAMKLGAGYPMGPFELSDYVGIDTTCLIYEAWRQSGDPSVSFSESKMLNNLVKRGHFGKKSGKGFYDYTVKVKDNEKPPLNPDLFNY